MVNLMRAALVAGLPNTVGLGLSIASGCAFRLRGCRGRSMRAAEVEQGNGRSERSTACPFTLSKASS